MKGLKITTRYQHIHKGIYAFLLTYTHKYTNAYTYTPVTHSLRSIPQGSGAGPRSTIARAYFTFPPPAEPPNPRLPHGAGYSTQLSCSTTSASLTSAGSD